MIKIEVKEYCQECHEFEAAVEKPAMLYSDNNQYAYFGNTIIRCKNGQQCENIECHIRNTNDTYAGN